MTKFGGFFARKAGLFDQPSEPLPASAAAPDNPLELDEELFSALGAQLGSENETLRNLLIDANNKIGELDTIKAAVAKLADPVSNTLRTLEAEKSEKISLQTVLNNTRTAYGKLRNEVTEIEKKLNLSTSECLALRQELATTQNQLKTVEATRAEIAIDIAARRAQIADLEGRLVLETAETTSLREDNHRLSDKLTAADKRIITLESDLNAARQRLLMLEDEKRAQQSSLDKASADAARLSRKLAETEASLNAAQGRLRHVEANFTEVNTERARLATALEAANERREHELTSQRMRFEALQARTGATDKLLIEAREHLLSRAEEIRQFDRTAGEIALERDSLQGRVAELEAERIKRDSELTELHHVRATLTEHGAQLARAFNGKEAALTRAEEANAALNQRVGDLEVALSNGKQAALDEIEELKAALRREKMERSVTEGALETGRKDFARLMREVMALQRQQTALESAPRPRAANAA
jgi:chromosome segregation ATPase